MMKKGMSQEEADTWSKVGIVAEDGYWMWIRDAVIFPSGACGTYNRILWKTALQSPPGVAVVPVLANKKILLNLTFRHATRSWEMELPRGVRKWGETLEDAAVRELEEETGYSVKKPVFLGKMATDSGLSTSLVPLYLAEVSQKGETHPDYSEAIKQNLAFSKDELKQGIARGYIEIEIDGTPINVPCRDSFIAFALLVAEIKGLL
jgi:ADP-ribose pyrophosphatase